MESGLTQRQSPRKSEKAITDDSWKGSMGSLSLFKFTKGEVEAKEIIKVVQQKHLVAYLQGTSMRSLDLRMEGKANALLASSLAIIAKKCPNRRDTSLDDNNHSKGRRNDRDNGKGKRNAGHLGNDRLFKEVGISRYEESNVVSDKHVEFNPLHYLSSGHFGKVVY